ncbi:MAG TPA: T9SS type A sorting domain-containing protein [Bacteroidia bacterium]|jgi:hypothetical protein|nr:T9SS type A sorting domain-containing protein [Bacteroidia bacterium]MBP9924073.1 T9SS type A sorting domain-containing protein [Bacteroidia bacterium]HQW24090.1 T9SS type A sorting domain-containing protein [Bacteroidia bacterium]
MKIYGILFFSIFIFQYSYSQQRVVIGASQYGISGNLVYKADTLGNTDWVLDFSGKIKTGISDTNHLHSIVSDGKFLYIKSIQNGTGIVTYYPAIIVLDTIGAVHAIRYWEFNQAGSYSSSRNIANIDGGIWLFEYLITNSYHLKGTKIDSLGLMTNSIDAWMSTDTYFNGMDLMNDSSYVLSTTTPYGTSASFSTITKINRSGSAIWRKSIQLNYSFCYPGTSEIDSAGNTIVFFNFTDNGTISFSGGAIFSPTGTVLARRIWPNDSILANGSIEFQNQTILYDDGVSKFNFDYTLLDSCLGTGVTGTLIITPEILQVGSIPTQYASTFLPVQNSLAQVAPYNTLTPPVNFSTDYCLVLNNEEMNNNLLFDMFPNPVSSILQIRSTGIKKNHGEITYEIYNLNSSLIVKGNLNFEGDETTTLNVSRFQDGMYLLKIISDDRINLSKFVKM